MHLPGKRLLRKARQVEIDADVKLLVRVPAECHFALDAGRGALYTSHEDR